MQVDYIKNTTPFAMQKYLINLPNSIDILVSNTFALVYPNATTINSPHIGKKEKNAIIAPGPF